MDNTDNNLDDDFTDNINIDENYSDEFSDDAVEYTVPTDFKSKIKNDSIIADTNSNTAKSYFSELANSTNPFYEVFDPQAVVNRTIPAKSNLIDKPTPNEEIAKKSYYISQRELESLLAYNQNIKILKKNSAGEFEDISENERDGFSDNSRNYDGSDEEDSDGDELIEITIPLKNVDDANPATQDDSYADDDYDNYSNDGQDDDYWNGDESEANKERKSMRDKLWRIKDVIEEVYPEEEKKPDELFAEFLQENFKDYLLAKKISGKSNVKFTDKLIQKEFVKETDKSVEITDLRRSISPNSKKTSVLINRSQDMEIESIEVFCKCGEKTIIKFDEADDIDFTDEEIISQLATQQTETDIVVDQVNVLPLNYREEVEKSKDRLKNNISEDEIEALIHTNDDLEDEEYI